MISYYYSHAQERALQRLTAARAGCWVVATEPTEAELDQLATDFELERDNLTDAIDLYEAPRIEIEDKAVYIFTRYCHPEGKDIATEPLLLVYTPESLITVVRATSTVLDRLTGDKLDFITTQKTKVLLRILAEINRSYEIQLKQASRRILQLRGQMRQSRLTNRDFIGIIELEEDLNEFLAALQPQALLFNSLLSGKYLRLYEEDRDIIEDIERSTSELIEQVRGRATTLVNMRQAYDTIATNNLNAIFKRLTSIAIFLAIPTVISGLWGMNVNVPFHTSPYGFWIIVAFAAASTALAVYIFKRKRWL